MADVWESAKRISEKFAEHLESYLSSKKDVKLRLEEALYFLQRGNENSARSALQDAVRSVGRVLISLQRMQVAASAHPQIFQLLEGLKKNVGKVADNMVTIMESSLSTGQKAFLMEAERKLDEKDEELMASLAA